MGGRKNDGHIITARNGRHNIGNIRADSFLQLQPSADHITNAGNLGKPQNPLCRNIRDSRFHIVHQRHMMFTKRKHIYIFHDDDPPRIRHIRDPAVRKGFAKHIADLFICILHAGKDFFIHGGDSLRRLTQPFSSGIVTQRAENTAYMLFYGFRIYHLHPSFLRLPNHFMHLNLQTPSVQSPCLHKLDDFFRFD